MYMSHHWQISTLNTAKEYCPPQCMLAVVMHALLKECVISIREMIYPWHYKIMITHSSMITSMTLYIYQPGQHIWYGFSDNE